MSILFIVFNIKLCTLCVLKIIILCKVIESSFIEFDFIAKKKEKEFEYLTLYTHMEFMEINRFLYCQLHMNALDLNIIFFMFLIFCYDEKKNE